MSTAPKSQLELYLEQIEGEKDAKADDSVEEEVSMAEALRKDEHTKRQSDKQILSSLISFVLRGMLEDSMWVSHIACIHWYKVAPSLMPAAAWAGAVPLPLPLRPIGLCFLSASLAYAASAIRVYSIIQWLLYRLALLLFLLAIVVPVTLGVVQCAIMVNLQRQQVKAKHASLQLMPIIKRIQLVSMGGTISQPMPPVTKLESKHLLSCERGGIDQAASALLTAKEMRCMLGRSLLCSMHSIRQLNALSEHCIDAAAVAELEDRRTVLEQSLVHHVPTLATLEEAIRCVFQLDTGALQLPWTATYAHSSVESRASDGSICDETQLVAAAQWQRLRAVVAHLWCTYQLWCAYSELTRACHSIGGPLIITTPSQPGAAAQKEDGAVAAQIGNDHGIPLSGRNSYCDLYLTIRKDLSRLRGSYEQVVLQLYLAEQQLSQADALFYILPDSAQLDAAATSATAVEAGQRRVQALLRAVSALSGAGVTSGDANSCASDLPDLCAAASADIACTINALPTAMEYENVLSNIAELALATASRTTPAQRRADALLQGSGANPSLALLEREGPVYHRTVPSSDMAIEQQQYGDYAPGEEEAAVPGVHALSTAMSSSSNVIDVYTTTIPHRSQTKVGRDKLSAQEQADQEAATRGRASARSLLRELNQHLRLMRTAQVRGEGSGEGGGDAGSAAAGLATARVLMERVRELVSVGLEDGAEDGPVGVQMTTTLSAAADLEEGSLAVESTEGEDPASSAGGREAPLVQVGTLLLTEDELQRTNIAQSAEQVRQQQAMRAAFMSEVTQTQQGCGGGRTAFAAALAGRRVEATFGDDDSD
jgi:hypothetical protein